MHSKLRTQSRDKVLKAMHHDNKMRSSRISKNDSYNYHQRGVDQNKSFNDPETGMYHDRNSYSQGVSFFESTDYQNPFSGAVSARTGNQSRLANGDISNNQKQKKVRHLN